MNENNNIDKPEYESLNPAENTTSNVNQNIDKEVNNFNTNLEDPSLNQNKSESKKNTTTPKEYIDKAIRAVDKLADTKDNSKMYKKNEIDDYKSLAIICYIPFLVIFPLIKKLHRKSQYMHFHINQGFTLSLTFIAVLFVNKILKSIFTFKSRFGYSYIFGPIEFICYLLFAGVFALVLTGIINTINDGSKELPVIGKYKFIK